MDNNIFNFDTNYMTNTELCNYAYNTIITNIDLTILNIDTLILQNFINYVALKYNDNPYHNFKHAVSVLQITNVLLNNTINIPLVYKFSTLIAALTHDIDHPGHNSSLEILLGTNLAKMYNNESVLENHHCAVTIDLINSTDLLLNIKNDERETIKKTIIECIISTDMKYHKNMIDEFENYDNTQIMLLCKMIVHLADLGNQIRPFEISKQGSINVHKEIINQNIIENEHGICELIKEPYNLGTCETKFCNTIIKPLWNVFIKQFEQFKFVIDIIDKNIKKYEA